jgi:hypothetical protein
MEVGRNHDAEPRTGRHVDMRIDAALADQPKPGEPLQEWRPDIGPLSEKHERFRVVEPPRQGISILDMVIPNADLVAVEFLEAFQAPERVVVIIQD